MAFNSISTNSKVFNSIGIGAYQLSTVVFGGLNNLFKITGGRKASSTAPTSASISRHIEKDVTVGTKTDRRKASVVVQLVVPEGFTSADVDAMLSDIDLFATPANLDRLLMGES